MTDLQTATDIVAIVFMGIILLLILAVAIAGLVIKHKIHKVQVGIQERLDMVRNIPYIGKQMLKVIKKK